MSKPEDQSKEITTRRPEGPIILFFIIGFAASLVLGWGIFPKLLYSQKHQPIQFNHALHNIEVDGCESWYSNTGKLYAVPRRAHG